jgi:hypothetical protein
MGITEKFPSTIALPNVIKSQLQNQKPQNFLFFIFLFGQYTLIFERAEQNYLSGNYFLSFHESLVGCVGVTLTGTHYYTKGSDETPKQGVTQRYRLSWLSNSAPRMSPNAGGGSCEVSANEYSRTQEPK